MRLPEHNALWEKISGFSFDDPKAAITFSGKLATQQKWSAAYTQRVIEEYRRFIFLCCISPNGAAPSKAVDEAWHLHLTYTQSYWIDFCKNTLGKNIHHHPSAGGQQENHKHENWYAETLAFYEEVFGIRPPADIWPSPVVKKVTPAIQTTEWRIPNNTLLIVALLLLMPFVISNIVYGEWFPFYLKGPQFLWFYSWLSIAALIGFYLIRKDKNRHLLGIADEYFPRNLNIYLLTHLAYGKQRAVQTGVIDLYQRDLLTVDDNGNITVHNKRYVAPSNEENPLVPGFLAEQDGATINYEMISVNWYTTSPFDHPLIKQLNYVTPRKENLLRKYPITNIVCVIGIARVFQGMINSKPVTFLAIEIIVLMAITIILDAIMNINKALFQKAKEQLLQKTNNRTWSNDPVVSDFALNGNNALAGLAAGILLTSVFSSYTPLAGETGSSDWGSTSSCSGGSSCGSSCGGGGCGGCGGGGD